MHLPISEIVAKLPNPDIGLPLKLNVGWKPHGMSVIVALCELSPGLRSSWILTYTPLGFVFHATKSRDGSLDLPTGTAEEAIDRALRRSKHVFEFADWASAAEWLSLSDWM